MTNFKIVQPVSSASKAWFCAYIWCLFLTEYFHYFTVIYKHFCKLDKPKTGQKENGFLNPGLIETLFSGH